MNREVPSFRYSLTDEQLWLLASAFAPAFFLGCKNPYLGWLMNEIEDAQRKTIQSLINAGWAEWDTSDDSLAVNEDLYRLVEACVRPGHTLIINPADKSIDGKFLYFDRQGIVHRLVKDSLNELQLLEGTADIKALLVDDLRLNCGKRSDFSPITIGEQALLDFSQATSESAEVALPEAAANELQGHPRLLAALRKTAANCSFVTLFNQENPDAQHTDGFGILEGEEDLFLLEESAGSGKPLVRVRGVDADQIWERFKQTLPVAVQTEED